MEQSLAACKRSLDYWRERGNELRVAMLEADLNKMLDRLQELYRKERTHG